MSEFADEMAVQLRRARQGYVGIIGDSITAAAPLAAVNGRNPVQAAFGGARVSDANRLIVPLLADSQPSALLLAIGVNDTKFHFPEPRPQRLSDFAAEYRELMRAARRLTPHVGIVLIGPVAKGMEVGDNFFDPDLIVAFNQIIEALAAEAKVPTHSLSALAGPDGLARADATFDGVHLSDAGYMLWNAAVAQAWRAVLPAV